MSSGVARWVLGGAALANAVIGISFLIVPARMGPLVDLQVATATADNDLRAVYGGVSSALAGFFAWAGLREDWWEPALALATLQFGALVIGRTLSWLVAGWPAPLALALHAAEAVGWVACALTWRAFARAAEETR